MKSWIYFFAAEFLASYLLISKGVPLLPVLAGCAIAAGSMFWRTAPARKVSRDPSG